MGWAVIVRNEASGFVRCIASFMTSNLDLFIAEILVTPKGYFLASVVTFGWCYFEN